jgi:uncharacterized protein (TIGR02246 family)
MSPDDFMRAYEKATNAHDLAGTLALIAEDAVYLFSNHTAHVGKAAISTALQHNFRAISDETYRIEDIRWLAVSDEVAACIYSFRWIGTVDGKPVSGAGRGTSVLKKVDGGWRVAHEHLSQGKPPV